MHCRRTFAAGIRAAATDNNGVRQAPEASKQQGRKSAFDASAFILAFIASNPQASSL